MTCLLTPKTDAIYKWYCAECDDFVTGIPDTMSRGNNVYVSVECPACEIAHGATRDELERVGTFIYRLHIDGAAT